MSESYDEALKLYYELRPAAIAQYNRYILSRTPADLQADMDTVLAPNLPKLMISDTQAVPICDAGGTPLPGSPGYAKATDQYSGYIVYTPPA